MLRRIVPSLLTTLVLAATTLVPLSDLGPEPYHWGYYGGLWENGLNTLPPEHAVAGLAAATTIVPRNANGAPDPNGRVGVLLVGGPLVGQVACGGGWEDECDPDSFLARAKIDVRIRSSNVRFINGSSTTSDPRVWQSPGSPEYERIRSTRLAASSLSEKQVQAAWILLNNPAPFEPLPVPSADAYQMKIYLSSALRAMKKRYPNLAVTYVSSSVYRGYSAAGEPYGYEDGLTVRWTVVGQVETMRVAKIGPHWDTRLGSLNYETGAVPWLSWGPYLWADGANPRSDGLTWERQDFRSDGETLTRSGVAKISSRLLEFLVHEPTAKNWLDVAPVASRRRVATP